MDDILLGIQNERYLVFDSECMKTFNKLRYLSTILIYPIFEEPFLFTTDAIAFAIGALRSQGPRGKELPISSALRTLRKKKLTKPLITIYPKNLDPSLKDITPFYKSSIIISSFLTSKFLTTKAKILLHSSLLTT